MLFLCLICDVIAPATPACMLKHPPFLPRLYVLCVSMEWRWEDMYRLSATSVNDDWMEPPFQSQLYVQLLVMQHHHDL